MREEKVYGIDLGTTYSVIAKLDGNGEPSVIENTDDGSMLCALAVYFPEDGDVVVVGGEAKAMKIEEPGRVVDLVKRYIGKPDAPTWEFNGEKYDPITVSALILKRMKEYADAQGEDVRNVVITCPAYFGNTEKMATKQAGVTAGLNVLGIINEPTAAALNYCSNEFNENRKIMVYDLGGGTFDVTLLDFTVDESGSAVVDIVRSGGDDRLGGADWDKRLENLMRGKYASGCGIDESDVDYDARGLIKVKVEETKIALSNNPKKRVVIPGLVVFEVTRQEFEDATRDLVERTMDLVRQFLSDSECASDDIDLVLLVGGSTNMPMIQQAVEALFPGKVRINDPDLAVAKGAALYAGLMRNGIAEDLGRRHADVEMRGGAMDIGEMVTSNGKGALDIAVGIMEQVEEDFGRMLKKMESAIGIIRRISPSGLSEESSTKSRDRLTRSIGVGILNANGEYVIENLLFVGDEAPARAERTYGTAVANSPEIVIRVFENVSKDKNVIPCIDACGKGQRADPALKVKLIGDLHLQLPPNTPAGAPIRVTWLVSGRNFKVTASNALTGEKIHVAFTPENLFSEYKFKG